MMNEMVEYYDQIKEPVSECIIGYFYVVFEDNRWHRVQCIDIDTENVVVLFIDIGFEEEYKCDVLYPLEKKFCKLPPQVCIFFLLYVFVLLCRVLTKGLV